MSRELKFRAWGKTKLNWIDVKECSYADLFEDDKYIVQQFTGLKDKNGKEIYEGDILAEKHNGGDGEANIGQVYFAAGTFMINGDGTLYDHVYSISPDILEDYTVQGNIFENPELLK